MKNLSLLIVALSFVGCLPHNFSEYSLEDYQKADSSKSERDRRLEFDYLTGIFKKVDDFDGSISYRSNFLYKYWVGDEVYLNILEYDSDFYLLLKATYRGDEWIFLKEMSFSLDGRVVSISLPFDMVKRKVLSGSRVRETATFPIISESVSQISLSSVSDSDDVVILMTFLEDLVEAREVKVRFRGEEGVRTKYLTFLEQRAMYNMFNKYKDLKGLGSE